MSGVAGPEAIGTAGVGAIGPTAGRVGRAPPPALLVGRLGWASARGVVGAGVGGCRRSSGSWSHCSGHGGCDRGGRIGRRSDGHDRWRGRGRRTTGAWGATGAGAAAEAQPEPVERPGPERQAQPEPAERPGPERQAQPEPAERPGPERQAQPEPAERPGPEQQAQPEPAERPGPEQQAQPETEKHRPAAGPTGN